MRTLEFLNPVFVDGVNVTVRSGLKWHRWLEDAFAVDVVLARTGDKNSRLIGTIVGRMVLPAKDIPEKVLAMEHDPACTTLEGLSVAMRRAYGDDWTPDQLCTVLFFTKK